MSLEDLIVARISETGPMSVAQYMHECLLHPTYGYYTTRDPFGAAGDFITAPEVSQMFGEMIGLALAQAWLDQGAPAPFTLAELGPGRGVLMADILRATKGVPGFHAAAQIGLVEASGKLRAVQAEALSGFAPRWMDTVADLPDAPLFLVANEFFDALPVRQFMHDGEVWRERQVGLVEGALAFGLAGPVALEGVADREAAARGDFAQSCAALPVIMAEVETRIARRGGAALVVDYGDWRVTTDTFQAVKAHEQVDPLTTPGGADLTAHVAFEDLVRAAPALVASQLTSQGVFLERLGITHRAEALAAQMSGEALNTHVKAHRRLTHPQEMGSLFKTLAFVPKGAPMLPGLET